MKYLSYALLLLLSLVCFDVSAQQISQRRVIIDTDPGVDDAFALLLALRSPDLRVEAITVVAGNVTAEIGLPNALRMVEIAGRTDVPVAMGARAPLLRKLVTATYAHGDNGLGGVSFPDPKTKPTSEHAVDLMRRIIKSNPGQVSIIAIGPLTNLAMVIQGDRELAKMIREIVIMGGSLSGGNTSPSAEFNIYVDPEAARIVFQAGIPLTMVGLDVTRKATLTEEHVKMLEAGRGSVSQAAARLARNGLNRAKERGATTGPAMHDPLAVAAFLDKSILKLSELYVDVETTGELTAGETVGYRRAPLRRSPPSLSQSPTANVISETLKPNASVGLDVDVEKFFRLFIGRLAGSAAPK
jgi:pyrimidine-specific ribonucleoside hydrolase